MQDFKRSDIKAAHRVAPREPEPDPGHGTAYPIYVDGKAEWVIEAKKRSSVLTGMEVHPASSAQNLSAMLYRVAGHCPS